MDSTCIPGEIQCTQEVVDSLQGSHFELRFVQTQFYHVFPFSKQYFVCADVGGQLKSKAKAT